MTGGEWEWWVQEWVCAVVSSGFVFRVERDKVGIPCDALLGWLGWVGFGFLGGFLPWHGVGSGVGVWWWWRYQQHLVGVWAETGVGSSQVWWGCGRAVVCGNCNHVVFCFHG